MTYLDWAATTLPDPKIIETMAKTGIDFPGNPSSPYPLGKDAKTVLEEARSRCASVLGCNAESLTFTSGGTESNAMVFLNRIPARESGTVILGGLEHPSVAEQAKMLGNLGWNIVDLPPGADGLIAPEKLAAALEKHPNTRLVAMMGVNNEVGSIQPLPDLADAVRAFQSSEAGKGRPIHFHSDLVQTVGKTTVNLADLDVDSAAFAAHKIRGPRGVGLLYHRNPQFEALIKGGGQERGLRPGTENVAGAVAMAMALEEYGRPGKVVSELGEWLFEELLGLEGARIVPKARQRSPEKYVNTIISLAFPPIPGEVLARVLGESGFAVSKGSACSNNKKGKLPKAMTAMKVPREIATGMIRISIGPTTTKEELLKFLEALKGHVAVLSKVNHR